MHVWSCKSGCPCFIRPHEASASPHRCWGRVGTALPLECSEQEHDAAPEPGMLCLLACFKLLRIRSAALLLSASAGALAFATSPVAKDDRLWLCSLWGSAFLCGRIRSVHSGLIFKHGQVIGAEEEIISSPALCVPWSWGGEGNKYYRLSS